MIIELINNGMSYTQIAAKLQVRTEIAIRDRWINRINLDSSHIKGKFTKDEG